MTLLQTVIFSLLLIKVCYGFPSQSHRATHGHPIPPKIRFERVYTTKNDRDKIYERVKYLTPEDKENAWEMSGMLEGDIVEESVTKLAKNGLIDKVTRWPEGIVPVFINEDDFNQEDIAMIKKAIKEYHEKTCLRFRAYNESDSDYVVFQGNEAGCWSSVGRQGKGQVINLQNPGCMKHGTIVHEILHAVGFYHQQSSFDRDEYVQIIWDNIKEGKEHNFKKYDIETITDYGVGYDYQSVMHYSSKAFSKDGNMTIVPRKEGAKIGQREGMSKKDVTKLQEMYKNECNNRSPIEIPEKNSSSDFLGWLFDY